MMHALELNEVINSSMQMDRGVCEHVAFTLMISARHSYAQAIKNNNNNKLFAITNTDE
jgi:hypothetical protein